MRAFLATAGLLFCPVLSHATCIYDESLTQQLDATQVVFIATLTKAVVSEPTKALKNGEIYRVNYSFVVRERLKGDPASVTSIFTRNLYHDPSAAISVSEAEDVRLVPGDNVLVLANGEHDVQVGFCTPTQLWNEDTPALRKFRSQASNNSFKPKPDLGFVVFSATTDVVSVFEPFTHGSA